MKIICMGDSLTEGSDLERATTWPSLVESRLRLTVENQGIGGDTTAGMLARFPVDVLPAKPRVVVLMGGTNDLWWGVDPNLVRANLFSMVCQARYHDIAPVIGLPLPFCMQRVLAQGYQPPPGGFEALAGELKKLVDSLVVSARHSEVPVADFYSPMIDNGGKAGESLFLEDGLHPNRDGHRLMSDSLVNVLKKEFYF